MRWFRKEVVMVTVAERSAFGAALRVEGLEKSYGTLAVLRGVSFEVERSSIFTACNA